jgi:hypothetical protein
MRCSPLIEVELHLHLLEDPVQFGADDVVLRRVAQEGGCLEANVGVDDGLIIFGFDAKDCGVAAVDGAG